MQTTFSIEQLERSFQQPLPGAPAQYEMAHVDRQRAFSIPENAKQAAVLALLYPKEDQWHIVLIERMSTNPNDRHGGQISFPGGRFEDGDGSFKTTAIREAEEEVHVRGADVQVIGELSQLYIPVSNFLVYPFVGKIDYTPQFKPQETEVKSIIETPFQHFLNPTIRQTTDLAILGGKYKLKNVPYFDIQGKVLWGATAMMMNELLTLFNQQQTIANITE